jgi:pre-mRNA-processing factor 40
LVLELVGPSSVVLTVVLQAEAREKERVKEESKRLKKLELNFKNLLRDLNVDYELSWDEVKPKLENEEEYLAFSSESDRIKIYKDFQHEMEESCSHHHSRSKKSKKKKSKKYKSSSSESENEKVKKSKRRSRSESVNSEESEEEYRKKKSKKKHKRKSPSVSYH